MGTEVFSMRIDGDLLERIRVHAAKRGMSVQDYIVRTLIRDDFDQRLFSSVEETERFYGLRDDHDDHDGRDSRTLRGARYEARPSAGIR
jgi:hypothetical protein